MIKISKLITYLLYLLLIVELCSWAALQIYSSLIERSSPTIINPITKEVGIVESDKTTMFPTRWFSSAPNFRGKYVVTDNNGFRIDQRQILNATSIGFYGGSTMFSVTTAQENAIPNLVQVPGFNSLNFGPCHPAQPPQPAAEWRW